MEFLQPQTWAEALQLKAAYPHAVPIQGGTDVMVELNFNRFRPETFSTSPGWVSWPSGARTTGALARRRRDLREGPDRAGRPAAGAGHGVPHGRVPADPQPGDGRRQPGAASPAGDAHPPLLAACAPVEAASVRGTRLIPVEEFFTGPKRNALEPDELI